MIKPTGLSDTVKVTLPNKGTILGDIDPLLGFFLIDPERFGYWL